MTTSTRLTICDLAATDASFEESRQNREAAMNAHAEVSIRDRIGDSVRARPRTQTILLTTSLWCGRRNRHRNVAGGLDQECAFGTHRGSVWVNMRGSLWKCSQLQCRLATPEGSRGLEIQNQLLDDMKTEFHEFPGRRVYTDVEREGVPPTDAERPPAAPPSCRRRGRQDLGLDTHIATCDIASPVTPCDCLREPAQFSRGTSKRKCNRKCSVRQFQSPGQ